ncbi:mannosyltransferase [Cladophialophora chaetospira]|uniref:Mannosyltransferase n=1 Tax=Cladophialophora chaetospira TaxID=386627 RepID=A0AA38X9Z4_9EURO|nr:mannosyltransferase [Cladophialophora chaetospira]
MPGTYQYFHEIDFEYHTHSFGAISHCDPRFAPSQALSIDETKRTLLALMKTYAATMKDLRAETWIAHGTLLGWHWNQKFLPWDNDIDVQMSVETLAGLVPHNMSEYHYPVSGDNEPRTYLLDINPHYTISSTRDVANKIDGRWIDITNGKYIDITAVHVSHKKCEDTPFNQGVFFSKDGHDYGSDDLFPLQEESFEGISVKVPYDSAKILAREYGKKSLTNARFHWQVITVALHFKLDLTMSRHRFNKASNLWEPE